MKAVQEYADNWLQSEENCWGKHWTRKENRVGHKLSLLAGNVLEKYIVHQKKTWVQRKLG